MGTIAAVALGLVLVGVAVGAAAWDRSHGRKDEKWDDWGTLPAWTYPLFAACGVFAIVLCIADGNWLGAAWIVVIGAVTITSQYRRRHRA